MFNIVEKFWQLLVGEGGFTAPHVKIALKSKKIKDISMLNNDNSFRLVSKR